MVIFSETSSTGAPRLLLDLRACPRVCPDAPYITYDRLKLVEKTSMCALLQTGVITQRGEKHPAFGKPVADLAITPLGVGSARHPAHELHGQS